jgi:hypothetical protein
MSNTAVQELCSWEERRVAQRLFAFATVLQAAGALEDTAEYFDTPWKWQREYELWQECGSPVPPEPGELTPYDITTWTAFADAVTDS